MTEEEYLDILHEAKDYINTQNKNKRGINRYPSKLSYNQLPIWAEQHIIMFDLEKEYGK